MNTRTKGWRGLLAALGLGALLPAAGIAATEAPAPGLAAPGAILWKQQFGSARPEGVSHLAVDAADSIIAYGTTAGALVGSSFGGTDVFLAKFTSAGTRAWVQQLGAAGNDKSIGMALDGSGDIAIVGSIAGQPAEWFLARYSGRGGLRWKRVFTSAQPADVAFTEDGRIAVVTASAESLDLYSGTGNLIGRHPIGRPLTSACCLARDRSGNLIVGGTFDEHFAGLAKLTAAGSLVWVQPLHVEFSNITDVGSDRDGRIIAIGVYFNEFQYTFHDVYFRLNDEEFVSSETQTYADGWTAVAVDGSGQPFMAGTATLNPRFGKDAVVTSLAGDASLRWRSVHGTTGSDYANDIAIDSRGNLYIAGWTNGPLGGTAIGGGDAYILKLRPY